MRAGAVVAWCVSCRGLSTLTSHVRLPSTSPVQGLIVGPESLALDAETGRLVTGLADGRVVSLRPDGGVDTLARTGTVAESAAAACGQEDMEPECGRCVCAACKGGTCMAVHDAILCLMRLLVLAPYRHPHTHACAATDARGAAAAQATGHSRAPNRGRRVLRGRRVQGVLRAGASFTRAMSLVAVEC